MEIDGMTALMRHQRHKIFSSELDPGGYIRCKRNHKYAEDRGNDGHDQAVCEVASDVELCEDRNISVEHPFFREAQAAGRLLEGIDQNPCDGVQRDEQHERHQKIPEQLYRQ